MQRRKQLQLCTAGCCNAGTQSRVKVQSAGWVNIESARTVRGQAVPVRALAHAFIWPLLERWSNGGTGWKYYVQLLARLANATQREVTSRHFDAVARLYLDELEKTMAGHDRTGIYYGFNFMVAMMLTVVSQPDRVERLSFGNVTGGLLVFSAISDGTQS